MRGKVFGLLNNGENIAASLPLALVAVSLDALTNVFGTQGNPKIGFQIVLVIFSLIVFGLGSWAWNRTKKALQNIL
jgi:hypothetical protein